MTYLTVQRTFRNGKPIVFNTDNRMSIHSAVISANDLQSDLEGNKTFPEGGFLVAVGTGLNYKTRFLPRTRLAAITSTGSASISLATPNQQFLAGDVLYAKSCYARVKLLGTYAVSSVLQLRIGGVIYSTPTAATAATTAADVVTAHAAALLTAGVTITAAGDTLSIFGNDSYDIAAATSLPASSVVVESTIPGYLGDALTPLGTILTVGTPNPTTGVRVVTLTANAAYVIPSGCSVGINHGQILGLYPDFVDCTAEPIRHIACLQEISGIYQNNLPYVDADVKRVMAALYINKQFYTEQP